MGMALVTYLTRVGGLFLAGRLPTGRRWRAALTAMPGVILVSLVAPLVLGAGVAEAMGAMVVLALARRVALPVVVVAGIVVVAVGRAWLTG
ncbi:MAG: AzlD domain-containing protein [Ectothiorhodospiraceae bacterium]|nr:AzlD domain-containing protein [Ectothiorhodospiraceae bacterium]